MPESKKLFQFDESEYTKDIALRMALYCVRNTVIENHHAAGKISDPEMMAFNKEVVNKLYTFLELISNPDLKQEFGIALQGYVPILRKEERWDMPVFDAGLKKAVERRSEKEQSDKINKQ